MPQSIVPSSTIAARRCSCGSGLTLWDLEREFAVGGFAGKSMMKLRDIRGVLGDSYCRSLNRS
ncbi:hypothetical protein [Streptomyces sp. NPDC005799]|uniref:hypothetical protein n=1 Tax=Streptomyces sp. NPDC005799 TaxID=3154678 RepID=UPI0033E4C3B2